MPQILKNHRFFVILNFKINQIKIKNIQNIWWSAILCFGKPLKTIVANFILKWINYSRKIVSNDLKGFLQGIWALKQDYKDTKLKRYKNSRLQNFKDTKIQGFYFNLLCCFTGLVKFFAVLFVSHRTSSLARISTQRGIMKRIRTINETLQMLKQEDPNSGLSDFLIRKLANNYKIRSFKTGNKILIDYDSLMAYLRSEDYDLPMEQVIMR